MSREKDMAVSILENLGGKENIISMTNCMTRLRVEVKDKSRVKKEGVNAVSGVIKLLDNGEGIPWVNRRRFDPWHYQCGYQIPVDRR